MAISTKHVIELIIRPSLSGMDMGSAKEIQLMAGTCAQESQMGTCLKQIEGPALGIWQIEPFTHHDIHDTFLRYRPDLAASIYKTCNMEWHNIGTTPYDDLLIYNLRYACCMARIKYLRVKEPLPEFDDIKGQAAYWKNHYNTLSGKGDISAYMTNYNKLVKPYYTK